MDIGPTKKELTSQELKVLAYHVYEYAALHTSSGQYYVYPEELAAKTGISQKSILENAERILTMLDVYFSDELLEPAVWDGESFDVNLGLYYCMYIDYEDSLNKEFSPGASALEEASMLQINMGFSDEQMLQIQPLIFNDMDYGELLGIYDSPMEMFDVRKRIERAYCRQDGIGSVRQEKRGVEMDKGYEINTIEELIRKLDSLQGKADERVPAAVRKYAATLKQDYADFTDCTDVILLLDYESRLRDSLYHLEDLRYISHKEKANIRENISELWQKKVFKDAENMIQNEVDENILPKDGKTPFDLTEEQQRGQTENVIESVQEKRGEKMDKGYEIYRAVKSGDLEKIKILVEEGGNVNYVFKPNIYGNTPLHIAAYFALKHIVEYLLKSGADVNAFSKDGKTPLALAEERHNRDDIIKILLHYGAIDGRIPIPDYARIGDVFLTSKNNYLLIAENGKPVEYERSQLDIMCSKRKTLENLGNEIPIDFSDGIHNNTNVYYTFDFESYASAVLDELSNDEQRQEQREQAVGSVQRRKHSR